MFATKDLETDEMLFAIPRSLHIGFETAQRDKDCGARFAADGYALAALCTFVAKQHLCAEPQFGPYLATLTFDRNATDVLHWNADEMALLEASGAAHTEAEKLRDDAEDIVGYALHLEPLRQCVRSARNLDDDDELDETIAEAVISAHAAVLSRSFGVPGASCAAARELIPVLDAVQHGVFGPTIRHDTETVEGLGLCTVARAAQRIAAGDELWNWYGEHPDFVFATQFGFVPSAATPEEGEPTAPIANCACQLSLGGEASAGRIGASIALAAQMRVAQAREAGETMLAASEAEEEAERRRINELRILRRGVDCDGDLDGQLEIARLLWDAGAWAEYPLRFVISHELIDEIAADTAAQRFPSNRHGGAALVASARLCALDVENLRAGVSPEEADPNTQLEKALRSLCVNGWLSAENDREAAKLVRAAAARQLSIFDAVERRAVSDGPAAGATSPEPSDTVRAVCRALARQVRASEVRVLRTLAYGDGADRLFSRDWTVDGGA